MRDEYIAALTAKITERNEAVLALAAKAAQRDKPLSLRVMEREQSIQSLLTQLAAITNSRTWKLASFLRRLRVLLAPPKSRRARTLRRLVNVALAPYGRIEARRKLRDDARQRSTRPEPAKAAANPALDSNSADKKSAHEEARELRETAEM